MRILFLWVLAGATLLASATEPSCEKQLAAANAVFSQSYDCHYEFLWCFTNSGELGRRMLDTHPNLFNVQDFQILIVKHKDMEWTAPTHLSFDRAKILTPAMTRATGVSWKFHVFLIYRGRVFDLDHKVRGKSQPISRYLKQMFPAATNPHEDLEIYEIPLLAYLAARPTPGDYKHTDIDRPSFLRYPKRPFREWL